MSHGLVDPAVRGTDYGSLIIAGIHAYLGLHVVERGVIFVDLSLASRRSAQPLPCGDYDPHSVMVY